MNLSLLFLTVTYNDFWSFKALLFSATFRKKIERLARDILVDPIRVVQGDIGEVLSSFLIQKYLKETFAHLNSSA